MTRLERIEQTESLFTNRFAFLNDLNGAKRLNGLNDLNVLKALNLLNEAKRLTGSLEPSGPG